jgi:hypothetical protein
VPAAARIFRFVQLEVPWPLGPGDGRYVVRRHAGADAEHVLVLATLGAPQRRRLRGRREQPAAREPDPAAVATGRATVIPAAPLADAGTAAAWLRDADRDTELAGALGVLNAALHAHRVAAANPHAADVGRTDAIAIRLGWGEGEQVADGRWSDAVELPAGSDGARRRRGDAALRPQERLAALLGGRDVALACEELTLRARADLDAGRTREAALQLRTALDAALAELEAWRGRADLTTRLDELAHESVAASAAADAALRGGLDEAQSADVTRALGRLEAALRARSALGFEG